MRWFVRFMCQSAIKMSVIYYLKEETKLKKRFSKFLALALAMIMIMTALPVSAVSLFGANKGSTEKSQVKYPAKTFTANLEGGLKVTVEAPEGALPKGTEMKAVPVDDIGNVQAAVDFNQNVDGSVIVAVDITFTFKGEEIQPLVPVKVSFKSNEGA